MSGFDRDKAFYPTLLAVIATYYVLFAVMSGSTHALLIESAIVVLFLLAAFAGFKRNLWIVVAGLATHAMFDSAHAHVITNRAVPNWWPAFCLAYDAAAASFLSGLLLWPNLAASSRGTRLKSGLELKIPPLLLSAIVAGSMWLTTLVATPFRFHVPGSLPVAPAVGLVGLAIAGAGVLSFRRSKTTVNPTKPGAVSTLVVAGVYRFTRNPMYLGFLLALLGWGLFLSNALAMVWVPLFVCYMNRFQIHPEERVLALLFPHDFLAYKARVRRWI